MAAAKSPQPELQIRADKGTEYKIVKKIIGDAKGQGMVHVGFMTTDAARSNRPWHSVRQATSGPMADINVTPLVDVMLVLLIIFMITAPMLAHKIKIDLPQPNQQSAAGQSAGSDSSEDRPGSVGCTGTMCRWTSSA